MRQLASCADNLLLFGEMLGVASGYVDQCEDSFAHEDAFMVALAHDQICLLRERLALLDERLQGLEVDLRPKRRQS